MSAALLQAAEDAVISDFKALKEAYERDKELLAHIENVVAEWLRDDKAGEGALMAKLLILLGKQAGRLVHFLLTAPLAVIVELLSMLDREEPADLVHGLRRLLAKYHHSIFVKLLRLNSPLRVLSMKTNVTKSKPLVIKLAAVLANGDKVEMELDETEIEELIKVTAKERIDLIKQVLEEISQDTEKDENISITLDKPQSIHTKNINFNQASINYI